MQSFEDSKNTQIPSRLSLKTVWDIRQGKEIDAIEFFKQPEGEIMNVRRQLQLAISTDKPLYVCPYCRQMVRLSGRKTDRGQVSFFSHLYDSDACFIKTTTGMTKEQIEASKYGLVSESARHKRLKSMIADLLQSEKSIVKGISQVQVEKRINSPLPYMNWRRPDVQAKFNQFNLVFELQLSTTFISTIVDRDIFYRLNNYFIIWVFNFEDNQEYVNLSNLMCKDIYYANKRNVFVFDHEAQQKSLEEGELILKCNWLDPDNTWHFSQTKNQKDGILISLDQLQYDLESGKPYYYDADTEYFKDNPDVLEKRKHWEMSREEIVRALMEKEAKEKDLFEGQDEQLREETRKTMVQTGACASVYKKDDRMGLSYGNVILVPPIYSSISEYNCYGYAIVSNNKHKGLVDELGYSIIPCEANEIRFLCSDIIIYRKNPYWYLVGASSHIAPVRNYSSITLENINDYVDCISFGQTDRRAFILLNTHFIINEERKGEYTIVDFAGNELPQSKFPIVAKMSRITGHTWPKEPLVDIEFKDSLILLGYKMKEVNACGYGLHDETRYGVYDYFFNEIVSPKNRPIITTGSRDQIIINSPNGHCSGVISEDGSIAIPLEYAEIQPLGDCMYKAKKVFSENNNEPQKIDYSKRRFRSNPYLNRRLLKKDYSFWGVLSNNGEELLHFEYEEFDNIEGGKGYIVKKNGRKGVMDNDFKMLIPFKYGDIAYLGDLYFMVRESIDKEGMNKTKSSNWGIISIDGEVVLPFEYEEFGKLAYNYFTIKQNGKKGIMSLEFKVLIPCTYGDIKPLNESLFKAQLPVPKGRSAHILPNKWGVISNDGEVVLPFEYERIGDIKNGFITIEQRFKKGIVDLNFKVIIPCIYDDLCSWGNGLFLVTKRDTHNWQVKYYYLINCNNERIDQREYRMISELDNNRASVLTIDWSRLVIDADGQVVSEIEETK